MRRGITGRTLGTAVALLPGGCGGETRARSRMRALTCGHGDSRLPFVAPLLVRKARPCALPECRIASAGTPAVVPALGAAGALAAVPLAALSTALEETLAVASIVALPIASAAVFAEALSTVLAVALAAASAEALAVVFAAALRGLVAAGVSPERRAQPFSPWCCWARACAWAGLSASW